MSEAAAHPKADRELDLVLFGATGFTGGLTAEYLARARARRLRWALAGRNPAKLEAVRDRLAAVDPSLADLPLLHADVTDAASLADVAEPRPGRDHHRRPLRRARRAAGRRLRRGRHRLRRPDRRAGVRRPDVRRAPRDRAVAPAPGSCTPAASTRSRTTSAPASPSSSCPTGVPLRVRGMVRSQRRRSPAAPSTPRSTAFSRVRQMKQAHAERRQVEPRPEGRKVRTAAQARRTATRTPATGWCRCRRSTRSSYAGRRAALERYGPDFTYSHYAARQDAADRRRRHRPASARWSRPRRRSRRCAGCC